jgi:hypothetical protein
MIYRQDPPYRHLTQMPSSCWPTSIQMILFRHWIRVEQEKLSYDLWLVIEEKTKPSYTLPFKVVPDGDPTHWLKIYRFEQSQIIQVLRWFGFKPHVLYYSDLWDFERLIIENLSQKIDIMVNIKREWISHNDHTWWHIALISAYDAERGVVTICDPAMRAPNYREVEREELKEAMSDRRDGRERWIIIIEKITEAV